MAPLVLVPTNFSDASNAALAHAIELARCWQAEIVLLHALDGHTPDPDVEGARQRLDDAARGAKADGVRVRALMRRGSPWQMVTSTAEELGAGLIVIGLPGHHDLPEGMLGNIVENVVGTARVPVLTVRSCVVEPRASQPEIGERTVRTTPGAAEVGSPR